MVSDLLISEFDKVLRTVFVGARSQRPNPGGDLPEADLSEAERRHAVGLMRVNHCGEICAQALYRGQAFSARMDKVSEALKQAAADEVEHLAWTEQRISELGGRKSLLNPLWYLGAFSMGVVAGRLGDKWSLGFLAETERQVAAHLDDHLGDLPAADRRSREIVRQMKWDEARHADMASRLGAAPLPATIKLAMKCAAKTMTSTAYYL